MDAVTPKRLSINSCESNWPKRWKYYILLTTALAVLIGAAMAGIPLAAALQNSSCPSSTSPATLPNMNTCWKPLLEMDGRGFLFAQQHVAAFLQNATDATLVMTSLPPMDRAPGVFYDYPAEVSTLIEKLASITTQQQKDEVSFFDGKLNIALGIIGSMLLGYGQSIEEIVFHSFGETTAVHDAGVAVWKNKLMNSKIRPTTAIQKLYPETVFTINDGTQVRGEHFQALVRVMPHSEYPSGSSCMCTAIEEYLTDLWPALSLTTSGASVPFDANSTPVILHNTAMAYIPLTGTVNPSADGYTARTLSQRCGETREEGGMHFSPSVPAGRALCAGMGSMAASVTKSLIPGLLAGTTTVRSALGATAPCEATCCSAVNVCSAEEEATCAANCSGPWDLPWFDVVQARMQAFGLPDRTTAVSMEAPFFQVDRNQLVIVGLFGAAVPEILKSETIFQLRYTNTVDNLVWNSIAANSATLKALKYGQSREATEPTIRSGQSSSDARVITAVHTLGAALNLLLPSAAVDFSNSLGYALLSPTVGIDADLAATCGALESASTTFSAACLQSWYLAAPGPSRLGQTIAYELMFYKVRDGWNSLGTDGGCSGGAHFCHLYADTTGYDPESGACLREALSSA